MREPGKTNYHLLPEIMWGVSKTLMVHAEGFLSNQGSGFKAEGASVYFKARFLSVDEVHTHFRMAAFGRYSYNNSIIHQPAIDFFGHSSGFEAGLVATQLINKVAISATGSLLRATDNGNQKFPFDKADRAAIGYTLSVGKLFLPKMYTDYKQVNVNGMLEFLGQTNTGTGDSYLDVAPSIQFIINSRFRVDAGYRFPLIKQLARSADKGALLRLEYNIFNLY